MTRTIGPVTSTIGAASALVLIACWGIREWTGFTVPADIQGFITMVVIYIAGWLVSPKTALERARAELHKDEIAYAERDAGTDNS